MPKRTYTREQMDKQNAKMREKRKTESLEEKQKRYAGQLDWSSRNPDKIVEYRAKTKEQRKKATSKWQKENKDKAYANNKKWRLKCQEELNRKAREYRSSIPSEIRNVNRRNNIAEKKNIDPVFKFSENVRVLINTSFKRGGSGFKKCAKAEEILGCSLNVFKDYILSLCPQGVTLRNFSRYGYHIDHGIPISSANTIDDVKKLCHYTNL